MRSRLAIGTAAFLAAISAAWAQEETRLTTAKERPQTVRIGVSGEVVLDYVWRGRELTAFMESYSNPAGTGAPATSSGENSFEGHAATRMDIELSDKVSALVEIGTKRVDGGFINEWGTGAAPGIRLREAAILLKDFLLDDLVFRIGIADWAFDVRGRGSSFAFDPRRSQSLNRNLSQIGGVTVEETDAARLILAGTPDELEPVGATIAYTRSNLLLELVLLPAAIEGGQPDADETLYALDAWFRFDERGSKAGMIVAVTTLRSAPALNTHAQIWTIGGGADVKLMDGALEVYAEAYFQFGKSGEAGGSDAEAEGWALQAGAQYALASPALRFGLNFTWISGDGDTALGADDKTGRFASYENVRDLMILEDPYFGFDWDSNYLALKVMAGATLSVAGGKDNLDLVLMAGLARAAEPIAFTAGKAAGRTEDVLGNEIDLRISWSLNKQASFGLGVAYLFGSDILENSMSAAGAPDARAEDSTLLYTLGLNLRF